MQHTFVILSAADMKRLLTLSMVAASLLFSAGCSDNSSATKEGASGPTSANVASKEIDPKEKIKQLEAKAEKGDSDAQLGLAKAILESSWGSEPGLIRVRALLSAASDKGNDEAKLGLFVLQSIESTKAADLPNAETLRTGLEKSKDPLAVALLGNRSSDPFKALAAEGYPIAIKRLVDHYGALANDANSCRTGKLDDKRIFGRISDYTKSVCEKSEKLPEAHTKAADYAEQIFDVKEIDADRYRFWTSILLRAPEYSNVVGSYSALQALQARYVDLQQDRYRSTFASAFSTVGKALKNAERTPQRLAQAIRFLKRAAELGDSTAQNTMGEFYQNGEGVPKDFDLAARYFTQAAQQGSEDGAKNIGLAYARAEGVPQDFVSAYFWFSIGALGSASQRWDQSEGSKRAQAYLGTPSALRDKLAQKMSPEQIAEAQQLTRDWKPSIQTGEPGKILPRVASDSPSAGSANNSGGVPVKSGLGTAFFVAEDGIAVTNNHVVDGCKELRVEGATGATKLVAADKANDMAILRVPRSTSTFATILGEQTKLRQGEEIVVFGFPLNSMLASGGNLTPGVVSALAGVGNNSSQIQITAAIQPGSSGSPVLNKKGEVIGVVSSKLSDSKMAQTTGSVGQNVNFAVSGQTLRSFLDAQKVTYRNGAGLISWSKSSADLADEAKKWTFVVECWK